MRVRLALIVGLAACGEPIARGSLVPVSGATPEVRAACDVTEHKCTRCHTIGRVLAHDARTREDWEPVVMRMRRMASSGITEGDVNVVLSCLEARRW